MPRHDANDLERPRPPALVPLERTRLVDLRERHH
jgi:hypothetical protein